MSVVSVVPVVPLVSVSVSGASGVSGVRRACSAFLSVSVSTVCSVHGACSASGVL